MLAGLLMLAAPGSAAAQALVIELSSGAPSVTRPERQGPLIEIVSLTPPKPRGVMEIGDVTLEIAPKAAAELPVEIEVVDKDAAQVRLEARLVATSERRLKEIDGLTGPELDAALQRLERSGEATIIAQPTLFAASGQAASFSASGDRPVETEEAGDEPSTFAFKPYGADLTLRPQLGDDGSVRLHLQAEIKGDTARRLESSANLRAGENLVVSTPFEDAAPTRQAGLPALARPLESPKQLALIVSASAPDAAADAVASSPVRGGLDGAPRGPPRRTFLASLVSKVRGALDSPYRTVRAGLTFMAKAGRSVIRLV
jgi:hypothetical protein